MIDEFESFGRKVKMDQICIDTSLEYSKINFNSSKYSWIIPH